MQGSKKTQESRGSFQCNFPRVYSTIKHLCWLTVHRTIKLQSQMQVVFFFLNTRKRKKSLRRDCSSCTQLNLEHVFETLPRESKRDNICIRKFNCQILASVILLKC